MGNTNTKVGMPKAGKTTAESNNNKFYWLNSYIGERLTDSTPFATIEDALACVRNIFDGLAQLKGKEKYLYTEIGENRWQNGRGWVMAIEDKGSLTRHIREVWFMTAITHTDNLSDDETDMYANADIPDSLVCLLAYIFNLTNGSLDNKNKTIEDIATRYYNDAETKAVFDKRAELMAKANTLPDVVNALFAY